jgi:RNA polymerase sigma-70 factor, ECF subfamily
MIQAHFNRDLRSGETAAFEILFRLLFPRLQGYCRLFVSDTQMAVDLVQDCFLKLWEKRESISDDKSVEALLYRMVRNRCLNYLRDNQKTFYIDNHADKEINEIQYLYQLDFQGREELSMEEMLVEAVRDAIDRLPARAREVFIKSKIDGVKQQEIAAELNISLKMVEKYIRQARDLVKADVEKKFPAYAFLIAMLLK